MSYAGIKEQIGVLCKFFGNKVIPQSFYWKDCKHEIKAVNSLHISRRGATTFLHFSVSTASSVFKLIFDTTTLQWWLDAIYVE